MRSVIWKVFRNFGSHFRTDLEQQCSSSSVADMHDGNNNVGLEGVG